jgi:hypothetical protein
LLPQCKNKDSQEYQDWFALLPQRKDKDLQEYQDWLALLPQCKNRDHPDFIAWLDSFNGIHMKDLEAYKRDFGKCDVSQNSVGYKLLKSWINHVQCVKKEKGAMKLTSDMTVLLDKIGFNW